MLSQLLACAVLLEVRSGSSTWLLVGVGLLLGLPLGLPQGLLNLANQNALYRQADPARMGSAAGLLRTALYLGAITSAAAVAAAFGGGVTTEGLHHLTFFVITCSGLLLVTTLADRSLTRD